MAAVKAEGASSAQPVVDCRSASSESPADQKRPSSATVTVHVATAVDGDEVLEAKAVDDTPVDDEPTPGLAA
jgi:hypothetical protein